MTTLDQVPFGNLEFADNPEPRCACLLLLDTSGSMKGDKIQQLNAGLNDFARQLRGDSMAAKRVEVAIVTFGPVKRRTDIRHRRLLHPAAARGRRRHADGRGHRARHRAHRRTQAGLPRQWHRLLPAVDIHDLGRRAHRRCRRRDADGARRRAKKSFMFYAVGVENADIGKLASAGGATAAAGSRACRSGSCSCGCRIR